MTATYGDLAPIPGSPGLNVGFVKSSILNQRLEFWVFRPQGLAEEEELPVLYLLHGTWAVASDWIRRGEVHQTAQALMDAKQIPPYCIVCLPDGGRGDATGYLNWSDGSGQYEDALMQDLIPFVEKNLALEKGKETTGLAGLSMGAFGAFYLALKHAGRFGAVAGHSGIYEAEKMFLGIPEGRGRIFSSDRAMKEASPMDLVGNLTRDILPAMRFDCGTKDGLLVESRKFEARLRALGLSFEYDELPGGHDWNYWKENVHRTLLFMGRHFEAHKKQ